MRENSVTTHQSIVNKINAKESFTYPKQHARYVVGIRNLYYGGNPSMFFDNMYRDVEEFLKASVFDGGLTIGGWTSEETGAYYVDLGVSLNDIDKAIRLGRSGKEIAIWDSKEEKEILL